MRKKFSSLSLWWNRINPFWLLGLPTVVALAITIVLMRWTVPVLIHVELITQRMEFVVDSSQVSGTPILSGLNLRSVGVESFSSIEFEPDTVEVADPSLYDVDKDTYPSTAWKNIPITAQKAGFDSRKSTFDPRVTIEETEAPTKNGLHLDPIVVSPGARLSVELRGGKNQGLMIAVTRGHAVNVSVHGPYTVIAEHIGMSGVASQSFAEAAELSYRVTPRRDAPWIEITGRHDHLVILPTLEPQKATTELAADVAVSALDFTRQGPSGERVSALTGKGVITFPECPFFASMAIGESEPLELERLDKFSIRQLILPPSASGLTLIGDGLTRQIRVRRGRVPIERHLTAFDLLTHNARLMALFAIAIWVVPTTIGAQRLFKEFKRP